MGVRAYELINMMSKKSSRAFTGQNSREMREGNLWVNVLIWLRYTFLPKTPFLNFLYRDCWSREQPWWAGKSAADLRLVNEDPEPCKFDPPRARDASGRAP